MLGLRKNIIKKIEGLDNCIELEELELYDNKILKIENIENLKKLRFFENKIFFLIELFFFFKEF